MRPTYTNISALTYRCLIRCLIAQSILHSSEHSSKRSIAHPQLQRMSAHSLSLYKRTAGSLPTSQGTTREMLSAEMLQKKKQ